MNAISTDGLTKRYGDVVAVNDLNLRVEAGEVYGFVGPNGAGKSTTIGILLDLIRPTGGSARVLGRDAQSEQLDIRERVGILPERCRLYGRLTAREHLAFAIEAHDADENPVDLLERVELTNAADRPAREYSTGMAQRLRLAIALVGRPALLILDEPESGLDPNGLARLREIVRRERDRGAAVFFSSHSLDQVRAVCDRVGILVGGELRADESLSDFEDSSPRLVLAVDHGGENLMRTLEAHPNVEAVEQHEDGLVATITDLSAKAAVLREAEETARLVDFSIERRSLEDVFARLAGEEA